MAQIGGSMAARKALPDEDHVMRFAPQSRQIIGPDGERGGPSPAAFELREADKGGLSVTWVEYFGGFDRASRSAAAAAHRETLREKRLPASAIFAWAKVAEIKAAGKVYRKAIRVVHDPVPGNVGHAEIRHFTDDDLDLLEYMASDVFTNYDRVNAMDIPPRP
ncbi:hypothetical protein J2W40_000075 [Sphingobium xenophagum]|uniref:Uncharacterized protein n=1 Tax=Sphingobium xenophagum TaxID=121428 RepID=A0ABU1WVC8_SPHXE|nr:hypothetical protein [Sphingobium xenophagum]MDR7153281.1 hypothetical protein [Sphingobium xenophagum]